MAKGMSFERKMYLEKCKRKLACRSTTCSACPLEDFCYYGEDVNIEAYVQDASYLPAKVDPDGRDCYGAAG